MRQQFETAAEILADYQRMENETTLEDRFPANSVYGLLKLTAEKHPNRPASSFQMFSEPGSKAQTLSWRQMLEKVTQAANLFRSLGVGEDDAVAYLLPGLNEAVITVTGAMTAGKANPINPLLEPEIIASILRESGAKVLVTIKSFPKVDLAEKAAQAAALAPNVETIVEIDMLPHLSGLKKLIVPMIRPKMTVPRKARVLDFQKALAEQPNDRLTFEETSEDRICAMFHTGGTTGTPKLAQHRMSGAMFNGWANAENLFTPDDVVLCPLPLFHVMAVYPIWMGAIMSGAHMVQTTPAGYRGDGVWENFWKLIEHWKISIIVTVPTAAAMLLNYPVNADVSSLRYACSGSSPFPTKLFEEFEQKLGVSILEGYGMTEATCLVTSNPPNGPRKVGSVGIPTPYSGARIFECDDDGNIEKHCGPNEIGEICIYGPGVVEGHTYTEDSRNKGLYAVENGKTYLRTGDLGYLDEDDYLWITGRKKDLIIRGGHNIDPAEIEEALVHHPDVTFVGAIGEPDALAGELPVAYVELAPGGTATEAEIMDFARKHVPEQAAVPKRIIILPELPKTAVHKVFKPDLRKQSITHVFDHALADAGLGLKVAQVIDVKNKGMTAYLSGTRVGVSDEQVNDILGDFIPHWDWKTAN